MEESKIRVGDIVTLKSGGPNMTVSKVTEPYQTGDRNILTNLLECCWFNGGDIYGYSFISSVLRKVNTDEDTNSGN